MALIGIYPRNREHRESLIQCPLDEAALLLQVEEIVFVDPWRDEQHRYLLYLLGSRIVLDQFHHVGAKDDAALRRREIFTDFKGIGVGSPDMACIGGDVVEEIREAFGQVGAAALKRLSQDCRVCRREVRGRNGVDETLRKELNLLPRWSRQVRLVADQFPQPLGSYQVIVLEQVERDVFIPFLILEAAVLGRGWLFFVRTEVLRQEILPKRRVALP